MKLTKSFEYNGQVMDVQVRYSQEDNVVGEILLVSITSSGQTVDATDIMTRYFDAELNKLIDSVDWRELAFDKIIDDVFKS